MTLPVFGSRQPIKSICSEENHTLPSLCDSECVGRRFGTRQWIFLERFRLRIEAANLAGAEFCKPDDSVRSGVNAARQSCRRRLIACDLARFRVDLEQLAFGREAVEPDVVILIDFNAVGVRRRLRIIGELFGFRIEAAERSAAGPNNAFRIDAKCMLRPPSRLFSSPGAMRILILGRLYSSWDPISQGGW